MVDRRWQEPPTVPLLQWLARGPLKQNLLQSVRLWVTLHFLYGEAGDDLGLVEPFTYADWRDRFFSASHPTDEKKPNHDDASCPCNKVAAAWLFAPNLTWTQPQWQTYRQDHSPTVETQIQALAEALQTHSQLPTNLESLLQTQLFAMTRRTLYADLRTLVSMSWLTQKGQDFYRVTEWPTLPQTTQSPTPSETEFSVFVTQPDLAAISDNLSGKIQGDRRFFVHVDYVVPRDRLDRVDDWQALLSQLWQRAPIPPVQLHYQRAGATESVAIVVYPVCIYYFRRGPYLCGYGQVPGKEPNALDWRNYRLDRLQQITPLSWQDEGVPLELQQRHHQQTLPHPDDIALRIDEAWGFDYYQPTQLLLLRFDAAWDARYIRHSSRHSTFKRVPYSHAQKLIQRHVTGEAQPQLLQVLTQRSDQDAYYTAVYRENDPNVHQRLRAWRPHGEVLLPWALRQQFADEVRQEWELYGWD